MNSAGLIGFEKLPREIRGQLDGITERWKRQLGARLIGLYLHGSIALDANPAQSRFRLSRCTTRRTGRTPAAACFMIAISGKRSI